jgi:hypothetical protein
MPEWTPINRPKVPVEPHHAVSKAPGALLADFTRRLLLLSTDCQPLRHPNTLSMGQLYPLLSAVIF